MRICCVTVVVLAVVALLCGCGGGGGGLSQQGNAVLRVQDNSGTPVPVELAAFQDGDGPWSVIEPTSTGVYEHTVSDGRGRYSFAFVYLQDSWPSGQETVIRVYHYTMPESNEVVALATPAASTEPEAGYTVRGAILGGGPEWAEVWIGGHERSSDVYGDSYLVTGVPAGEHILVGVGPVWDDFESSYASTMVLRRAFSVSGDCTCDIDFGGSDAFDLAPRTINVVGADDFLNAQVLWEPAGNPSAYVSVATCHGAANSTFRYGSVPSARRLDGDTYLLGIQTNLCGKYIAFSEPRDLTIDMNPAPIDSPAISDPPAAGQSPIYTWGHYPGATAYSVTAGYSDGAWWSAVISRNWFGDGNPRYELPDLSNLPGWRWGKITDGQRFAGISAIVSNAPLPVTVRLPFAATAGLEVTYVYSWLSDDWLLSTGRRSDRAALGLGLPGFGRRVR